MTKPKGEEQYKVANEVKNNSDAGKNGGEQPRGKVLSTKDAARICKVALSTIVYWFDKGLIKGYKTPGGHRRIFLKDLEMFMVEHEIPLAGRLPDEKFRVLVVDDEPQVAEFFFRSLEALDGEIEFASAVNGFQAGRLLSTFRPNIVFLDLVMPGLDGFEVCKLIMHDPDTRDVEVIAITGHDNPENLKRIIKAGASHILRKPLRFHELKDIVEIRLKMENGKRAVEEN